MFSHIFYDSRSEMPLWNYGMMDHAIRLSIPVKIIFRQMFDCLLLEDENQANTPVFLSLVWWACFSIAVLQPFCLPMNSFNIAVYYFLLLLCIVLNWPGLRVAVCYLECISHLFFLQNCPLILLIDAIELVQKQDFMGVSRKLNQFKETMNTVKYVTTS